MSSSPTGQPSRRDVRYRFGLYEANTTSGELLREGKKIRLQEQPFQVLIALLERRGEVITREDLRQRLWAADTFVDFDHSLNTAINKLRDALRDSAADPKFVETLARRGYRFIAPVEVVGDTTSEPAAAFSVAPVATPSDLPSPHRGLTRTLFALAQVMYLCFYIAALANLQEFEVITEGFGLGRTALVALFVTAPIGIALRLYLITAVAFDYRELGRSFRRLFVPLLLLDELWALSPFLLQSRIGLGLAFAAVAALLYVPFSERTLIRMAYPSPSLPKTDTVAENE